MNKPNFPAVWSGLKEESLDAAQARRELIERSIEAVAIAHILTHDANIKKLCEVFRSLHKNRHVEANYSAMCLITDAIEELRAEEQRDRGREEESKS
jgi:hypothetical protein